MRLKDIGVLNPPYKGKDIGNELVSFSPMECLRYDSLNTYTIPFSKGKGNYTYFGNQDILFAKVTPCFENMNFAIADKLINDIGFGSSEINVLRLNEKAIPRYIFYLICGRDFQDIGCASMKGVGGLRRVDPFEIISYEFDLPSLEEQQKIADYLDRECGKIDRKVELLEKKSAAYQRLRQSLINQIVTKGLYPNVPMKPSGIEWIGDIPEHWEIKPLRSFITLISPERKEDKDLKLLSVTRDKGVILRGEIGEDGNHNRIPEDLTLYKVVRKNQFVINKMKAWMGSYGVSEFDGIVSPAYFVCDVKNIDKNFFSLAIRNKIYPSVFLKYSKGIRVDQWDLTPISLKEIPFSTPPLEEQREIVEYLDEKCGKIDAIIENITKQVQHLKTLKRALINETVTGKRIIPS